MARDAELAASGRIPPSAVQPRVERVQPKWNGQRCRCSHSGRLCGQSICNYKCRSVARRLELSVQLGALTCWFDADRKLAAPWDLVVAARLREIVQRPKPPGASLLRLSSSTH